MNSIINFVKTKWYYIAAAVLLVIVVVIVVKRSKKNDNGFNPGDSSKTNDGKAAGGSDGELNQDATFPLTPYSVAGEYSKEKGSMGIQIKTLQNIYNKNLSTGTPLTVDGKYGDKTLGAFLGYFGNEIATNGVITKPQYDQIIKKHAK